MGLLRHGKVSCWYSLKTWNTHHFVIYTTQKLSPSQSVLFPKKRKHKTILNTIWRCLRTQSSIRIWTKFWWCSLPYLRTSPRQTTFHSMWLILNLHKMIQIQVVSLRSSVLFFPSCFRVFFENWCHGMANLGKTKPGRPSYIRPLQSYRRNYRHAPQRTYSPRFNHKRDPRKLSRLSNSLFPASAKMKRLISHQARVRQQCAQQVILRAKSGL